MEKLHFVIKIKGFATYHPEALQLITDPELIIPPRNVPFSKPVTDFKKDVEKLLSQYYKQIKGELDALVPTKINPPIDGEFFLIGVEDEAHT